MTPKRCKQVSPQCPNGQEDGYRLGYDHGQVQAADDYNGTPCEQVRHKQELETVEARNAKLEGQVAALRHLLQSTIPILEEYGIAECVEMGHTIQPIEAALSDTAQAAADHDRRVRVEADGEGFMRGVSMAEGVAIERYNADMATAYDKRQAGLNDSYWSGGANAAEHISRTIRALAEKEGEG